MAYRHPHMTSKTTLRISQEQRTVQHWLGSVPYTNTVYGAVLYSFDTSTRKILVLDEATGVDECDALANLVRSWRLPC